MPYQRTFKLKTTTALFMHGADPDNEAELRPPAIKGIMRYWFRALAGADYPIEQLRNMEEKLFGVADANTGSRLVVRVGQPLVSKQGDKFDLLPHKDRPGERSSKSAIPANKVFEITIQARPATDPAGVEKRLEVASWVLWLAVHLGGFGQRSRRGAGSLELLEMTPPLEYAPAIRLYPHIQALADDLETGLSEARRVLHEWQTLPAVAPTFSDPEIADFPVLSSNYCRIQVLELIGDIKNEQVVREDLMFELRNYKNPAFGLPYMITAPGDSRVDGRHASPLHIHVQPLTKNGFALVKTALFNTIQAGQFLNWDKLRKYLDDDLKNGAEKVMVMKS